MVQIELAEARALWLPRRFLVLRRALRVPGGRRGRAKPKLLQRPPSAKLS